MVATDPTLEQKATSFRDAAVEVLLELLDDELGQPALLLHPLAKAWPVLGDGLVQDSLFRPVSGVAVTTSGLVGRRPKQWGWMGHSPCIARLVPRSVARLCCYLERQACWLAAGSRRSLRQLRAGYLLKHPLI
jgi:hypothetical protein